MSGADGAEAPPARETVAAARSAGPDGVLLADKPAGPTSHDVVRAVRRVWRPARVGHAGTLDPFATGLLVVLVGRATRLAEYASALEKTYLATLRLGASSTTGDPHGEILALDPSREPPPPDAVRRALAALVGEREQVPPAFSAKRVAGERAYRLARRGADFTLAPRRVRIEALELLRYAYPLVTFRARTGPGTYLRSLAAELGEVLGSAAYLVALRREGVGPFSVEAAVDALTATPDELAARLLPPEAAAARLPEIAVDGHTALALAAGRRAAAPTAARPALAGGSAVAVRLVGPAGFLGIGALGGGELRSLKVLFPERARA